MSDILVIDDCRIPPFECEVARTVEKARELLVTRDWDEVWWDHDMGPDLTKAGHTVTTRKLALWIESCWFAREDYPKIGHVYIHTSNGVGARWLRQTLANVYTNVDFAEMIGEQLTITGAIEAAITELRALDIEVEI